jgi:hypothetical protein
MPMTVTNSMVLLTVTSKNTPSARPGTGKLKIAGGVEGPTRESVNRAFAYLMGQKVKRPADRHDRLSRRGNRPTKRAM